MKDFQLRRTYRDQIYSYRPTWILRWGLTVTFIFLAIIICVSGFIKYPDIVPAYAEITTSNPPVHLKAKVNGKIENILINEGQTVTKGTILASLEAPVEIDDIKILENYLNILDSLIINFEEIYFPKPTFFEVKLRLGELQPPFSELLISYNDLYNYLTLNQNREIIRDKQSQFDYQIEYKKLLDDQKQSIENQFSIATEDYVRDSLLYEKGVVAERELGISRQKNILQYRGQLAEISSRIVSCKSNITSIRHEIRSLELQDYTEKRKLITQLREKKQLLRAALNTWMQNYLFISPIEGRASYTMYWSENQNVNIGDVIVTILPKDSTHLKIRILFPIRNSGKVHKGQRVNIKLENYPYQEFGMLIGKMDGISKVPNDSLYSGNVVLPNGLITSYGDLLPVTQELKGKAEVLTDDISLLIRFFNPIKAVIDEHFD